MFDKWLMDLQCFADDDTGVPDNPNVPDDDDDLLSKLASDFGADTDEDDDEFAELDEAEVAAETEETTEETTTDEDDEDKPVYSKKQMQAQINSLMAEARIKGKDVLPYAQELQELTGLEMKDILENVRQAQVTRIADTKGITEDEARAELQKDQKLKQLETQHMQTQVQIKQLNYDREKTKHMNSPYIKRYEAEIDEFAFSNVGSGIVLDFETAANFILGKHMNEILSGAKTGAEQKTLKDVAKRGKTSPVDATQSGTAETTTISPAQKRLAVMFGLDPKEVAAEQKKIDRERRRPM